MMRNFLITVTIFLVACNQFVTKENLKETKQENLANIQIDTITQTNLGEGLVIVPDSFEIYLDSALEKKSISLNMYTSKIPNSISPIIFKPDYGIMHFVCLSNNSIKSYKVLINQNKIGYIPKNKNYRYELWDEYILKCYGISILDNENVYENPDTKSKIVEYKEDLTVCPIEIKENWLKIKIGCNESNADEEMEAELCSKIIKQCNKGKTGWIKWKENNKLKVSILKLI